MTERDGRQPERRIAVSACLLGEEVRYDGGHRRSGYVAEALGAVFRLVPECPEVGIGLGVPRPKIRLEAAPGGVRLLGSRDEDLTPAMDAYAKEAARRFGESGVVGIVLKSRSPSCGLADAKLHRAGAVVARNGEGVFARSLARALPDPPRIRETDLEDPARRDHWLARVFAFAELRDLDARLDPGGAGRAGYSALQQFHDRWKTVLRAHSEASAPKLELMFGAMRARTGNPREALAAYRSGFLAGLARPPTPESHASVLRHLAGRLEKRLAGPERGSLEREITAFRQRRLPLAVSVRTLARHARSLGGAALVDQAYLEPRPPVLRYGEDIYRD